MISIEEFKTYKKFVFIENGIGPFISNIFINGFITWLVFKNETTNLVERKSIIFDLVSTGFLLPFITVFLASKVIKKQIRLKKLSTLSEGARINNQFFNFPYLKFAIFVGFISQIIFVCPILFFIYNSINGAFEFINYIYFKGLWCGIVALFFAPCIGIWVLNKVSINTIEK